MSDRMRLNKLPRVFLGEALGQLPRPHVNPDLSRGSSSGSCGGGGGGDAGLWQGRGGQTGHRPRKASQMSRRGPRGGMESDSGVVFVSGCKLRLFVLLSVIA